MSVFWARPAYREGLGECSGVFGDGDPGAPKSPETKEIQWFFEFAEPLSSRACKITD